MKLTAMVFVSLDGVYQGGGGPDEDRRFGFERGGWQAPYGDDEEGQFITSVYQQMDAMLLGRTTFEIWENYWPQHDSGDPVATQTIGRRWRRSPAVPCSAKTRSGMLSASPRVASSPSAAVRPAR